MPLSPSFEKTASMDLPSCEPFFMTSFVQKYRTPHLFLQTAQDLQINGITTTKGTMFYFSVSHLGGLKGSGIRKDPYGELPDIFLLAALARPSHPRMESRKMERDQAVSKNWRQSQQWLWKWRSYPPQQDLLPNWWLQSFVWRVCYRSSTCHPCQSNHTSRRLDVSPTRPNKEIQIMFRPRE